MVEKQARRSDSAQIRHPKLTGKLSEPDLNFRVRDTAIKKVENPREFAEYERVLGPIYEKEYGMALAKIREFDAKLRNPAYYIAMFKEKVIGTGAFGINTSGECEMKRVAVKEQYRGKRENGKVFENIVKRLEDDARGAGARELVLYCNEKLAGIYGELGYVRGGEDYLALNRIRMAKRL